MFGKNVLFNLEGTEKNVPRSEAEKGSHKSPAKRVLWEEEKQRHRERLMLCIKCVNCGFDFDDMGQ